MIDKLLNHYTIAEIATALDLSIAKVRQQCSNPPSQLCDATITEIQARDLPIEQIMEEYCTTRGRAVHAKYVRLPRVESPEKILRMLLRGLSVQDIHEAIRVKKSEVIRVRQNYIREQLEQEVHPDIIADRLNLTTAAVFTYKSNKRKHKTRKTLTPEQVEEIKRKPLANISELARHYGVSRTQIYNALKK